MKVPDLTKGLRRAARRLFGVAPRPGTYATEAKAAFQEGIDVARTFQVVTADGGRALIEFIDERFYTKPPDDDDGESGAAVPA